MIRKIVDKFVLIEKDKMGVEHRLLYDVLECGHIMRMSDAVYKRHCRECALTKDTPGGAKADEYESDK